MARLNKRALSTAEIHNIILKSLGDAVTNYSDVFKKPMVIDICKPSLRKFRIYAFNCGNPPGGRPIDEYKIVLNLGQQYGEEGNFDYSGGCLALVIGYVEHIDVFVLWDANKHTNFAYNKNMQVKAKTILKALAYPISIQHRDTINGDETIIATSRAHLLEAMNLRVELLFKDLIGEN